VPPSPTANLVGPRRSAAASPSALPFAGNGGQVTYWLDDNAKLRRLDALLRKDLPVRVDFNRDDRATPAVVEVLGGAPIAPRPVSAAEAQQLARLPVRDHAAHGGRVAITLPFSPAGLLHADGWLDWAGTAAYLGVRDADDPGRDTLVWADRTGVVTRTVPGNQPNGGTPPVSPPPLKPPAGGWQLTTWAQHDRQGSSDLDILLGAALAATGTTAQDAAKLRPRASWLRTDTLAGVPVTVYEVRGPGETGTPPGQGLLRYWVDGSGVLRRVQVRTGDHAFGYLDVTPGPVPKLTRPAR
jgi:hypothetical protein